MRPRGTASANTDDLSHAAVCTEAVLLASRVLVAVAARSLATHDEDVSLLQYRALVVLASQGVQRPIDLAENLGLTASATTRLCDRLVRRRLISRRRQGADRRSVSITLTAQGGALLEDVTARRRDEIRRIVDRVPPAAQGRLVRAFEEFAAAAGEPPA